MWARLGPSPEALDISCVGAPRRNGPPDSRVGRERRFDDRLMRQSRGERHASGLAALARINLGSLVPEKILAVAG